LYITNHYLPHFIYSKDKNSVIEKLEVVTSFKATINPVKNYAANENLVLHKWTNEFHTNNKFDLGLVVSFGHLLPKDLIESFTLGMLNIHASLLPKLRGASPIIHALKDGLNRNEILL
jgi:methionyl-tRNA formyltransferase